LPVPLAKRLHEVSFFRIYSGSRGAACAKLGAVAKAACHTFDGAGRLGPNTRCQYGTSVGAGVGTSVEIGDAAVHPADGRGRLGSDSAVVTASVSVRLLGPFGVARHGVAQALPPSRKVRALLAYLMMTPRPVERSALCELLWDVPDDPRGELRWSLSKIRKLVDEPGHARVRADREFVSIDRAEISVDACEVANTVEAGLAQAGPNVLERLAGRFAGEFLEGLTLDRSPAFGTWLVSQRHVFRVWHAQVLVRLAALSPSDPERGLAYLRQRLDLQRYDETAHADLLVALARGGRIEEGDAHVAAAGRLFESEGLPRAPLDRAWAHAKRVAIGACATRIAVAVERAIDARVGASGGRRASIAVMPFLAPPGPDGNLADGLSHDIISGLARLRNLFVIARGSTFALRDQTSNPQEIGRALNVDYAATGSVVRNGNRLLVTVDLCATDNGRVVWADAYEPPIADAFAILGNIAARIISSLDAEIGAAERNRAMLKPPNSLDAWEAHHRGLWHMYRFTGPDNEKAQRYFKRAVTLDLTFSRAYAGLSFTHWQNAFLFKSAERQAETDRAFDAAGRSLLADHRDPAAHWAMGRALWLRGEDAASVSALNEAVALSPNFAMGHYTLGFVQAQTGDPQAAVEATDVARQLSPFDPMLYAMCAARAFALFRLERCEEAAEWALKAAEKPNAHAHVHALAALILAAAGRLENAFHEAGVIRKLRPAYSIDDFLSSFRVLSDQERACRIAAKQIGIG
jgi:TolB-like protein